MTNSVSIIDGTLSVYHENTPDDDEPDAVIDASPINSITIDSRADAITDEATIDLDHPDNDEYDLRLGDRIVFEATTTSGPGYGISYGTNYGGGAIVTWTGRIKPTDRSRNHEGVLGASLSADATDYVAGILGERQITGTWIGDDVGAIIRDICRRKGSEIDASNIPDLGVTTDFFSQNRDCWDAITGLAARADVLLTQQGMALHVDPITDLPYAFDLQESDYYYPWETTTDDDVKNVIRVDSGTAGQQEAAQEVQDSFERVTESSRLTYRLRARKSEIHSIDLYINPVSDEELNLRLQADEGGAPVEIGNTDSDIEQASIDRDDLEGEGWYSVPFASHTLPDRDPWLIIESGGGTGHDIGVNGSGVPTYRSYYPHPLNFEDSDPDSIAEYGSRELRIEKENLETLVATRDAVQSELARRAWPTKTIAFAARSPRAHALEPGDVIGVNNPDEDAVGDYIVTEVSHSFDAGEPELWTDILATWRKGVLAPL